MPTDLVRVGRRALATASTGNAGTDHVDGGSSDDFLDGRLGNDHLDGGPDTPDNCNGGLGTDTSTGCETQTNIP